MLVERLQSLPLLPSRMVSSRLLPLRLLPPRLLVSLRCSQGGQIVLPEITSLLQAEDHRDYSGGDNPRDHRPTRNGSRSAALYAAERMLPIPLRLIIEPQRTIIRHRKHRNR